MRLIPLAALALLAPAALAQSPAEPDFRPEAIRAHVEFLADDLLEGRDAGTRGYDIAARYVATRFAALGLAPTLQQVPFVESRHSPAAPARLTIGGRVFENGGQVLIGAGASEPRVSLDSRVVFAGFCLDAPDQGVSDYAGLDVRGKTVACLAGFPKGAKSDIGAHLSRQKEKMAEARGAVAMLTLPTVAYLGQRSWTRRTETADQPSMTWAEADGRPHVDAPGIRIGASLNVSAANALFAGAPRSFAAVRAEADRAGGKPRGFELATPVRFERAIAQRRFASPNVLAMLPGSDPALAGEYVLLMAHLDHVGVDPKRPGEDKIHNGAMDNAAGVATLLEVARAMAANPVKPRRPILFAAVTAEEDGLLGAEYLAGHLPVPGKVVGVVNLDMPILLYDFKDVIAFGAEHSTLGPMVAAAAGRAGVKLSPDPLPSEGLFTRSDHYRFVQKGVPSVFLMTGFANGGEKAFKDFLATHYHRVSDAPDLPFDWKAGAKFARINHAIARAVADAPQAPRWYADSVFGNIFAKDAPKVVRGTTP